MPSGLTLRCPRNRTPLGRIRAYLHASLLPAASTYRRDFVPLMPMTSAMQPMTGTLAIPMTLVWARETGGKSVPRLDFVHEGV
jgi:hypothetical protein